MTSIKLCCLLTFAASSIFVEVSGSIQLRNVINDHRKLWDRHRLFYSFNSNIDHTQRNLIQQWMWELERAINVGNDTCFTFREKPYYHNYYLYITIADSGICSTESVGKKRDDTRQSLYLTDNCLNKRAIMSLLLETLGLYREHQRPDRDTYIQVRMDNVQDAARPSFYKVPCGDTDLLGLPYDFDSIIHYGPYAHLYPLFPPTFRGSASDTETHSALMTSLKYRNYTRAPKFKQVAVDVTYPQWRLSSEKLPDYMTTGCTKDDRNDTYTFTVGNGAVWMSRFLLPPGSFCVFADICIASFSPLGISSYIQLTTLDGHGISSFNYTQPGGQWKTLNMTYTSEQNWTMVLKSHIMWGGDILALDNVIVRDGRCG